VRDVPVQLSQPLAVVVGQNCKRIRTSAGVTQEELAKYAHRMGLRWGASAVGDFEGGRSAPTFATVLVVTAALSKALEVVAVQRGEPYGPGVTLADLVGGRGYVELTDALPFIPEAVIADVCRRGRPFEVDEQAVQQRAARTAELVADLSVNVDIASIEQRSGLAEQRLAKRLKVGDELLAGASFRLWRKTFSEERDRRAGPDANQQKKGRISRELRAELEKALADGDR
jgi:transcriptional regulator with XRE-family HTH domain